MIEKGITFACKLADAESLAIAQFVKRIGFNEWQ
jgi:hypothetical protein